MPVSFLETEVQERLIGNIDSCVDGGHRVIHIHVVDQSSFLCLSAQQLESENDILGFLSNPLDERQKLLTSPFLFDRISSLLQSVLAYHLILLIFLSSILSLVLEK